MPRIRDMLPARTITPTTGEWAAQDDVMQAFLEEIAGNVKLLLWRQRADDAVNEIDSHKLGTDEWVALWTRFAPGERRVLKAVMDARKEQA